jgi:hypothetical protein
MTASLNTVCDVVECAEPVAFAHILEGHINEEQKLCKACYQKRILYRPELAASYRDIHREADPAEIAGMR